MPADRTVEPTSPSHSTDDTPRLNTTRKRRTRGACDYCKRKKVRCDSAEMPGNKCSNCIAVGYECTHDEVLKTLRNMREYVEVLEGRLKKMDELLNKTMPGMNLTTTEPNLSPDETKSEDPPIARNDDDLEDLCTKIVPLQLNPKRNYFLGKSSGHQLFQTALEVKKEYFVGKDYKSWIWKRPEFWEIPSWLTPHPEAEEDPPLYIFPENELLVSLVDLYFTHLNPYLPLLHRPTFERSLEEKEHYMDHMFGGTVMLVCALGARFSNDPRVFMDGNGSMGSAGWKWYCQVNVLRKSVSKRTTLYELQMFALSVMYLQPSPTPDGVWTQVGMGLRLAQEVGAHRRRKTPDGRPNAENELWKRAFWVLVCLDRFISSYSGRPCGVQEEDFDLDFPVDCDDEYWDKGFTQPLGKPSTMTFFICYLKLMDIRAYAMRVIYPIRRPENLFGKAVYLSEQKIIAELDSAMNSWMDSIPIHLRWNPNGTDELLLKQSTALHASYYDLQIFIHRPFIPSPRNPQPGTFPSLAICTNAARMCCHVLDYYNASKTLLLPQFQNAAAHAAIILLLNIWGGKKSGLTMNQQRELADVIKMMKLLKTAEKRWYSAGRFFDVIKELAWAGELPLQTNSPSPGPSVGSNFDLPSNASPSASSTTDIRSTPESMSSVLSSAESLNITPTQPSLQTQQQGINFSLPVYTTDLGRLPIYGQFDVLNTGPTQSLNNNPFTVPVVSQQNQVPDADQYSQMGTPVEYVDNGSQNLFAAADFFVKNALFQSGQMINDDSMFYSSPMASLHSSYTDAIITGGNAIEFGNDTPYFSVTNARNQIPETSVAASIFTAYDKSWIHEDWAKNHFS